MCLMDWKLGRLIRPIASPNVVDEGGTIAPNQQRVAILISFTGVPDPLAPNFGTITFTGTGMTIDISFSQSPFLLSIVSHGDLPARAMQVGTDGGGVTISVIEFLMPEDYLNIPLEELERQYMPWKVNDKQRIS